jgi:hypothetical protein
VDDRRRPAADVTSALDDARLVTERETCDQNGENALETLGVWSQIQSSSDEEIPANAQVFQRFDYLVWEQEVPGSNPGAPIDRRTSWQAELAAGLLLERQCVPVRV